MAIAKHTSLNQRANIIIRLFLFILCAFFNLPVKADKNPDPPHLLKAHDYLLNYQLDSCEAILSSTRDDPFADYLRLQMTTVRLFIEDSEALYKSEKKKESEFLAYIDRKNYPEEVAAFLKAETRFQWGLLKMKYGDEFSSFWSLKQAFSIAKDNVKKYPEYYPSYKTLGILKTLFGLSPEKYTWFLSLFGLEGNVNSGLEELRIAGEKVTILSLECQLTIALLHGYLLSEPSKAVAGASEVYKINSNLLVSYAYAILLIKNAQSNQALQVINSINPSGAASVPYFDYLLGEIYLQQGRYGKAQEHYKRFLQDFKGISLVKDAHYKNGMTYYLQGHLYLANLNFDIALNSGATKNEADKYAQYEAETRDFSAPILYQMRYATDGGYFELAEKIRSSVLINTLSNKDKCEFYYRSGRLFHKTGKMNQAEVNYLKTIDGQPYEPWYFAPNAALQLGLIYISQNRMDEARSILRIIDNYKGYPYQSSIRQQKKAAMRQLR